eukprot:CAMPEP_0201511284 /NCGR_PEP_ID=MMETSP0161_2-20130828/3752_1 /ASSEMBLY_ACC=CAM_ASM_000251 /TAXON_ID=180227 /ORGANISM="Neoparamoeba aestuarina, Strain SoJaBio B1-5/56/2" /LENGTH=1798 /DNA_ID=CAMNT_0047906711 /DNA_START=91 /DNA_END=5487 /DNA_ORIENTATION=-
MMKFLVLVLLVVGSLAQSGPVNVKRATTSESSGNFASLEADMLYTEIQFEEDLEHSEDIFCSTQNYKLFPTYRTATCNPCNYSGPSQDGVCSVRDLNVDLGRGLPNCVCDDRNCQGEILTSGAAPKRYTIRERDVKQVFRYEHADMESGFLVRLIPIDEGPVYLYVSNGNTLDSESILGEIHTTSPSLDYVKVCPSFNKFGEGSETITYFIFVAPGDFLGKEMATYELSIEAIPNLEADEEEPFQTIDFWPQASLAYGSFGNSPYYLTGLSMLQANMGFFPRYFVVGILIPLEECTTFSFSIEMLHLNTTGQNYYSLISAGIEVATLDSQEFLANFPLTSVAGPFKSEEAVVPSYTGGALSISSSGAVFSACPTGAGTPENPEYVVAKFSASPRFRDYSMLIHLREVDRNTRTRTIVPISKFTPLHFQRTFYNAPLLRCPCRTDGCDTCETRSVANQEFRFFNRLSGLAPETYPALVDKANPPCDLVPEIGIPIQNEEFLFRCTNPWRDTTCGVIRVVPVFDSGNPRIYPMPTSVRIENPFTFPAAPDFLAANASNNNIHSDSLGVLFTLSVGDLTYFEKDRLLNECEIGFGPVSNIHTANDAPPAVTYLPLRDIDDAKVKCRQKNFENVSTVINQAQQELAILTSTGLGGSTKNNRSVGADELEDRTSAATYASYALLFSQEYQSCQDLGNSFLNFDTTTKTLSDSTLCVDFDAEDPCCNAALAWETCCVAEGREVTLQDVEEPLSPDRDEIEAECVDPSCIETYVEDYRNSYEEVIVNDVCNNEFLISTGLNRVVSDCRKAWIGDDEFGKLCYADSDCTDVFGTGQCDLFANRCTGVRAEMELGFLNCLLEDVDSVTRSAITNELARAGKLENVQEKKVTAELLRDFLIQESECASDYGPMSEHRSRFQADSLNPPSNQFCPVCYDVYCLSPFGCDWPLQCLDQRKACAPQLGPYRDVLCQEPTGTNLVCEYDNSLLEEDCDTNTPVCMYCHNSSHCEVIPEATDRDECENTPICLLPGGEIRWNVDEDECEAIKSCTELCNGAACADKKSCESIGGFCEDTDAIVETVDYAIAKYPTSNLGPAANGVCITPISADNNPPCPFLSEIVEPGINQLDSRVGNSWDFTTHRGCVNFTYCLPSSLLFGAGNGAATLPRVCTHEHPNATACEENAGGRWLPLPIQNEEDCENPLRVDEDEFPGFCLEDITGERPYLSQKGRRDCEECGGVPTPPATWRKGRWVGGLARRAEWRAPQMKPKFLYVADSMSFLALNDLLALSSANVDLFLSETEVSCSITPFVNYLSLFSCGCGGADSVDECPPPFQTNEDTASVIGGAWFCPGVSSKVGIPVGRLEINGSDVTGDLCKFAGIGLANIEVFVGNRERVPLSVLGDPNPIDAEAVRNENGASVGEAVGNGIKFIYGRSNFVDHREEVEEVTLTLFLDVELLRSVPGDHVFDLGQEVLDDDDKRYADEVELRPLNAKLAKGDLIRDGTTVREVLSEVDENDFIVEMTVYWRKPFDKGSTRVYPITREKVWKDDTQDDVLSQGEKIMVAVFGALYGLSFLISLIFTYQIFSRVPSLTNLILCFLVWLVFIFRCVYLSMFAAGYFREEDTASFILVEPPSFFIISIASVILMSFGFCLYCLKSHVQQDQVFTKFWVVWLVFNIFIYLIMVVVLVLETQLDTSDTEIVDCFGRVVEVDESFTVQAIRIAYHSFLLVVAVVTCASLVMLGRKLDQTVDSSSLSTLSIIAGMSVFVTSLLWVIYSAASGSSPYFVIPLFFCEALPLLGLMYKIVPDSDA